MTPDRPEVVRSAGRSMLPLIRDGSQVTISPTRPDNLAPGDIIVFRDGGLLIAHRLIDIQTGADSIRLRQKGDNQFRATWIDPGTLVGKAVLMSRGEDSRRLDPDARSRRVRALTACSRAEANALDAYLGIPPPLRAVIKWMLVPLAAVAWPLRRLLYRLLLTAYPREERPEPEEAIRLLIACFRGEAATAGDWTGALEIFARHGLLPLAEQIASRSGAPPDTLDVLKRSKYRAALTHTSALAVLDGLNQLFRNAGVDYAVLKGAHLYEAFYKDLFPREYEDIDLLVRPRDVDRALPLLAAAGYRPAGGRAARWFLRHGHFHLALDSRKPGRPRIELHWSLVDRANLYRIPDAELLGRARDFRAGDKALRVLSPEDTLIYLCLHAAKHGVLNFLGLRQGYPAEWFCGRNTGNRLLWFMDIERLLKEEESLEWRAVAERIRDWNVEDETAECLRVLCVLNPESSAARALETLGLARAPVARGGPTARLLGTKTSRQLMNTLMTMHPTLLFRPVRLLLAWRVICPAPDRIRKFYGLSTPWLVPLLYLIHPVRMLIRLFR